MAITTAMPTSFKSELFAGAHCFGGTVNTTGNTYSNDIVDTLASMVGISVGMRVSGPGIPVGCIVSQITSATAIKIYPNATATATGVALSFNGDVFRIALIRHAPVGTYGAASVNYADVTSNVDEVVGVGYAAGGLGLSNVSPAVAGSTAFVSFGGTISWTSATIDSDGCIIYNSGVNPRLGGASGASTTGSGRAIYAGDFGGRQQVASGTFTIVMPAADATHAILRLQ
jgi:hypothetical protein